VFPRPVCFCVGTCQGDDLLGMKCLLCFGGTSYAGIAAGHLEGVLAGGVLLAQICLLAHVTTPSTSFHLFFFFFFFFFVEGSRKATSLDSKEGNGLPAPNEIPKEKVPLNGDVHFWGVGP